jgi:hypothetical protein
MIYPSVTQLNRNARKNYNYWGIFSALLILLCWNFEVMVGCIKFVADVANFNGFVGKNEKLEEKNYSATLDYIDMMNGFGGVVLGLALLHL